MWVLLTWQDYQKQKGKKIGSLVYSSAAYFMLHADDLAFIKYVRVDRSTFSLILNHFCRVYDKTLLKGKSRSKHGTSKTFPSRRKLSPGLVLLLLLRRFAGGVSLDDLALTSGKKHLFRRI
jgi:hypothetical protein